MPNVRVGIREKPEDSKMKLSGFSYETTSGSVKLLSAESKHDFTFDNFFDAKTSQAEIFETLMCPIVDELIDGFNGTVFAYGQTGAGKTHTISGSSLGVYEDRGLCNRTAEYLFQRISYLAEKEGASIQLSVLEIYNDRLSDLLRDSSRQADENGQTYRLLLVDTPHGVTVTGLYMLPISYADEAAEYLMQANLQRAVAEHNLNRRSSRSHCVYTFYVSRACQDSSKVAPDSGVSTDNRDMILQTSKLHIVDLAGSERISKTGSEGSLRKEAGHINQSLLHLERVVNALVESQASRENAHIPYRRSKLTYLLKDSLGGNCRTYLLACVWPHRGHEWETLSTLRFAARMRSIESVAPVRVKDGQSSADEAVVMRALRRDVQELRRELALRDAMSLSNLAGSLWLEESSSLQKQRTLAAVGFYVCSHLNGSSETLSPDEGCRSTVASSLVSEVQTATQVSVLASAMRDMLWDVCGGDAVKVEDVVRRHCHTEISATFAAPGAAPVEVLLDEASVEGSENIPLACSYSEGRIVGENIVDHEYTEVEQCVDDQEVVVDRFTAFKNGAGSAFHDAYETSKNCLKTARSKQRELIQQVNHLKFKIDKLTQQIIDESEESDTLPSKVELCDVKTAYKNGHLNLKNIRSDIVQLEKVKQVALSTMLSAFEQYGEG